jgi:hypothetical protein
MRILKILAIAIIVVVAGGYGSFKYVNRTPAQLVEPNYFSYYKNQDTVPEGKVGLFITSLIMPETMREVDFYTLALKPMQYIPWPMRNMARADRGVQLIDPDRFYEFEPFTPAKLVDPSGNDRDLDGVPYVDKFHWGEVEWVPPSATRHLDHGYFLLPSRNGGMPTIAAKLINKARHYYYAPGKGSLQGTIPHKPGMKLIVDAAVERMQQKYGDLPYRWVTAEDFGRARAAMYSLLDEGVDTILLSAPAPIYSHHEEFNGGFKHAMHYIHEWQEQNGKHIKVIMAPQLGDFDITQQTWVNMLQDRLNTLPAGADVKVVMSIHGMAWDLTPNEAWIELAPPYVNETLTVLTETLEGYDFGRKEVVQSQDHFADPHNNPDGKYLSTNMAFWDGINDGFDYVINVPIEFFVENTDTLYSHAMFNFEHFPTYDLYEPIDYPDPSKPYTREFKVEDTLVIYNGVPAGDYNKPIIEAYTQALDSILSQGMQPISVATVDSGM